MNHQKNSWMFLVIAVGFVVLSITAFQWVTTAARHSFMVSQQQVQRDHMLHQVIPGGLAYINARTGVIIDVNPAFCTTFAQRESQDLIGTQFFDLLPHSTRDVHRDRMKDWQETWNLFLGGRQHVERSAILLPNGRVNTFRMDVWAVPINESHEYMIFCDPTDVRDISLADWRQTTMN